MRGDFSSWGKETRENFNGVLHQQGRVLLDSDWNAQTQLINDWQDTAGQDILGAGIAAVPAGQPDSFRIINANSAPLQLTVGVGRLWADGWRAQLYGANATDTQVTRTATPLGLQFQNPIVLPPPANTRDAVILELWREEVNGFQEPSLLIEPALGGVDTTERVQTAMAFRLLRLTDGETCESIIPRLRDNFDAKGKLTVTLQPTSTVSGDCPVVEGGGYTGFEHNLYRIEIAQVKNGQPAMFKWSQFNGSLVGRGKFDANTKLVTITANATAIINSGLNQFYLEAISYDSSLGHRRVVYGARVSLNSNGDLILPNAGSSDEFLGTIPTDTLFFRLWNGILLVGDFTTAKLLQDGILLQFDPVAATNYVPHDYWTFEVRAGEIANAQTLLSHQPPAGIHNTRVPLGVITWSNPVVIADCRRLFQPLTRLATCCSYRVGDGKQSHGDFDSIQEAVDKLPASGGEICVLPGVYEENVKIVGKHHITIKGCGTRSRVRGKNDAPVFHVDQSQDIRLESLQIEAHPNNVGVLLEGPVPKRTATQQKLLRDITLQNLHLIAHKRSAIEAHVGHFVTIRGCRILMEDVATEWAGIYFVGEDSLLEENLLQVLSGRQFLPDTIINDETDLTFIASAGAGGLHLGGGCERVRVINNLIVSGTGNGITLGSVDEEQEGKIRHSYQPWQPGKENPCKPRPKVPPKGREDDPTVTLVAGPPLSEILIERNLILNMGADGIGVDAFFDLSQVDEMIRVEGLTIIGNEIRHCLNRLPDEISPALIDSMGYGGIVLADVDDLVVRDNLITDNGFNVSEPICGIFVLHGEGIEIERNRIANNGAQDRQRHIAATVNMAAALSGVVKPGRRGGINIVFALAPFHLVALQKTRRIPFSNGLPAVKIHENIVSVPLGQALSLGAVGPVSVVGNQFTSLGVARAQNSPSFVAATVLIFNLGLSNELGLQVKAFTGVRRGHLNDPDGQPGLDDLRGGQYLANGNVLFTNNQCQLNLLGAGQNLALSSVLILSLDDIGFHNNQCDCDLTSDDRIGAQALLYGLYSVRASDNRFKETIGRAKLSAVTFGVLNTTTDNQSTHCLLIRGLRTVSQPNLVMLELFAKDFCSKLKSVQSDFGGKKVAQTVNIQGKG